MYYIGIDLGGTNIAVGIVDQRGTILAKKSVPTDASRGEEAVLRDMAKTTLDLIFATGLSEKDIDSVGIGTPGSVDPQTGIVHASCNLPFENTPMAERLAALLNKPVFVENDANCAALAEAKVGAGLGRRHVAMITLGTGVGGGIVIDGELYGGFNNFGGEFGHMIIEHGGEPCPCGQRGCLEAYASASALKREAQRAAVTNPKSLLWKAVEQEGKFSGRTAFLAAKMGDAAAQKVVDQFIRYLAIGSVNIIHILQPEILVIGGGVSHEGDGLFLPLEKMVNEIAYTPSVPVEKRTLIRPAVLGNDAGIIGAALLGERKER
jgi:glucokinase